MKHCLPLLLICLLPSFTNAQITLNEAFAPRPNDQWTVSYFAVPQLQVPVPQEGELLEYDLRFLADIDLGTFSSQTFSTINPDSLHLAKYTVPYPNDSIGFEERIQLPVPQSTSLMREMFIPAFINRGGNRELQFLDRRAEGIYLTATANFIPTIGVIGIDSMATPPNIFPYDFSQGDTLRQTFTSLSRSQSLGADFVRVDSTLHDLRIKHLGLGTVNTFFGDYENVSFVRHTERTRTYRFEQGSDIGIPSVFTNAKVYAYAENQYEPLAIFTYAPISIDDPSPVNPGQEVVGIDFRIGNRLTNTRSLPRSTFFTLESYPNPANETITIKLPLSTPYLQAKVALYSSTGQLLLLRESVNFQDGKFQLQLPQSLTPGVYHCRVQNAGFKGSTKVIIH